MKEWRRYRWLALLLVAVMVFQLIGCGGGGGSNISSPNNDSNPVGTVSFIARQGQNDEPVLTRVDGTRIDEEELITIALDSLKNQSDIMFGVDDAVGTSSSRKEFSIGRYWCRIAWDKHGFERSNFATCLPKDRKLRHINFELKDTRSNTTIGNWYLVAWWDNGPQFAIYKTWTDNTKPNDTDSYCISTEGKLTSVKEKIKEALMEAEFSPISAGVIATVAATIVFYLLFSVVAGVAVALAEEPDNSGDVLDSPGDNGSGNGEGMNPPSTPTPNPGGPIPMPNIPPDEPSDPPVTPDPPTPATLAGLATVEISHEELNFRIKVVQPRSGV